MNAEQIRQNVAQVRSRIAAAARREGRDPGGITLLAATKTRTPDEIRAAVEAGADAAGENRAQELLEKLPLGAYAGIPLHFIGSFQSNKAHLLVGKVDMVESLGTRRAAAVLGRLSAERGLVTDVLAEINVGREEAKSGFLPEEAEAVCAALAAEAGLRLRGLMAIPPAGEDGAPYFARMKELFDRLAREMPEGFDTLSMGMSGDFEQAIEAGATVVRVGTGLFGARDYGAPK